MSFVTAAALAISLLIALPFAAHLLRRGRRSERPFPPARLVPAHDAVARQKSRLEDRGLLALRALIIVTLALLGAVPLVRCDRPLLARSQGASVALALVLDDSASMNVKAGKVTRFEQSVEDARALVGQLRPGDRMALVLAGRPARVQVGMTSSRAILLDSLAKLSASDRGTDLEGALGLAESLLAGLPQRDKRIALASDLAAPFAPPRSPFWLLRPEHAVAKSDCGLLFAQARRGGVTVELACNAEAAAAGRKLSARATQGGPARTTLPLPTRRGRFELSLPTDDVGGLTVVTLDGSDENATNDTLALSTLTRGRPIWTLTHPTDGQSVLGGPPLLEQALLALDPSVELHPLAVLPTDARELQTASLLLLDDPPALGAEQRLALAHWLEQGGALLALLGERAVTHQLGQGLAPLLEGAAHYEATDVADANSANSAKVAPSSFAWLGPEALRLADLRPRHRWSFELGLRQAGEQRGTYLDGTPLYYERIVGKGWLAVVGLPAAPSESELALTPGFLALLQRAIEASRSRSPDPVITAGSAWTFGANPPSEAIGPAGRVALEPGPHGVRAVAARVGPYRFQRASGSEARFASLDAAEVLEAPRPVPPEARATQSGPAPRLALTSPLIGLLLLLLGLERAYVLARGPLLARFWAFMPWVRSRRTHAI